jgi:hypothetical protein
LYLYNPHNKTTMGRAPSIYKSSNVGAKYVVFTSSLLSPALWLSWDEILRLTGHYLEIFDTKTAAVVYAEKLSKDLKLDLALHN